MPRTLDGLSILLLQARTEHDMRLQEQACFAERCRLKPIQFRLASAHEGAARVDQLEEMDAFMIGGAGEFSATEDYSWTESVLDLIRVAIDREIPTFGSCWGHQMIARALGGEVIHDPERAEMGCYPVNLTASGRLDALLKDFPDRFLVNMGHHDRVSRLPEGAVELAVSDTQPNQAFRLVGLPVYGTQFHSELDAHRERERLIRYRPFYEAELGSDESFNTIMATLADTTEVDHLMHDFLVRFALDRS